MDHITKPQFLDDHVLKDTTFFMTQIHYTKMKNNKPIYIFMLNLLFLHDVLKFVDHSNMQPNPAVKNHLIQFSNSVFLLKKENNQNLHYQN